MGEILVSLVFWCLFNISWEGVSVNISWINEHAACQTIYVLMPSSLRTRLWKLFYFSLNWKVNNLPPNSPSKESLAEQLASMCSWREIQFKNPPYSVIEYSLIKDFENILKAFWSALLLSRDISLCYGSSFQLWNLKSLQAPIRGKQDLNAVSL